MLVRCMDDKQKILYYIFVTHTISFSKKTISFTLAHRKKGKKGATIPYARTCYG